MLHKRPEPPRHKYDMFPFGMADYRLQCLLNAVIFLCKLHMFKIHIVSLLHPGMPDKQYLRCHGTVK